MDDHFWPAMYPGLIVGLLYGLSLKGLPNIILGVLGGLTGAALAYLGLPALGVTDDLASVAGMVVLSFAGAYALTYGYRRFSGSAG